MRYDIALTALLASGASAAAVKKGFVTTKGTTFQLDGKDFYFAGSNAYYLPFFEVNWSPSTFGMSILTFTSKPPMSKRVLQQLRRLD